MNFGSNNVKEHGDCKDQLQLGEIKEDGYPKYLKLRPNMESAYQCWSLEIHLGD